MESQKKRVLGRTEAMEDIARVSDTIRPILMQAVQQPTAQALLKEIAQEQGTELTTLQAQWIDLQEADLLLEAGGRPDAVSSSKAVGVAQWLASTGRSAGLKVDSAQSTRLGEQIAQKSILLGWATYLAEPTSLHTLPNAPRWTQEQAKKYLLDLKTEIATLDEVRSRVDERYDREKAIFAQTLYLLKLYRRFPSFDWVFQAYHGGEGGVNRLLKLGLGSRWNGSSADAIRAGRLGGKLTYEDYYLDLDPLRQQPALAYLMGRSDHHRYYWWKIRVAQEVLKAYRENREALVQEWSNLYPGRSRDVLWYPAAHKNADPKRASPLKPETLGVLELIRQEFIKADGTVALTPYGVTLSSEDRAKLKTGWLKKHPAKPPAMRPEMPPVPPVPSVLPEGLPPLTFDYHGTGVVVDISLPQNAIQRSLLEYALSQLADQGVLAYSLEKEFGTSHFHITPNPRHADALRAITVNASHTGL